MNKNNKFTGSEVKNKFTAYLFHFIRGRRSYYLKKKIGLPVSKYLLMCFCRQKLGFPLRSP